MLKIKMAKEKTSTPRALPRGRIYARFQGATKQMGNFSDAIMEENND